ncbi:uncharacterized protein N7459_008124 [Penicillium hispanicum]|uniref:uncharacterized protein n=1 Tax=Penicillium hispanicum TaxID=1080232 RepID=UPI002541D7D5|nr:uncharacterized protein N7459_008124 [Penicillium hispanicum]KAJ5573697.1 hypothetical protein N7459_008124 [Penicillium hispanicum]
MVLALLPLMLVLVLSSLANAAAIPSASLVQLQNREPVPSAPEQPELTRDVSERLSANPDVNTSRRPLTRRTPYYFPETVPDEQELAGRLSALREAGFVPSSSLRQTQDQTQDPKSIGTSDAEIDTARAQLLLLPDRDGIAQSGNHGEPSWEPEWASTSLFPPLHFLIVVAAVLCVVTIVRGVWRAKH